MKTRYSHQPYYHNDQSRGNGYRSNEKRVSRGQWYHPVINLTLVDILYKLFMGIKRIFVALKYQVFKNTQQEFSGSVASIGIGKFKVPWVKLVLIGIVIFLFTQKDFQFSFNMKAPLSNSTSKTASLQGNGDAQQMNVAQTISLLDRKKSRSSSAKTATPPFNDQTVESYIKRFRKVALMEMKKFGIPASIKMAWGILETQGGMERADNNHFGALMEGQPFTTAWENWRLHSVMLQSNYSGLFHSGDDYKSWVKALDKADVSSDRNFDKKMLNLIERYQLFLLDQELMQY